MSPFNSKKRAFRGYPKPGVSFDFLADFRGMTFGSAKIFPKNLVFGKIRGYPFHNLEVVHEETL